MEERNKIWYELDIMEQYLYPKMVRGAALLNLEDHMVAQRFNLLKLITLWRRWVYIWESENYSVVVVRC